MKKILLVDDETDILELLTMNLESQGLGVIHAQNGQEALEVAKAAMPDVIVLDIMLPKLDGYQVLERLRADPKLNRVPVLMLTAKGELNDRLSGLELGADDYLAKPFSPKEVVLRIQNLLKRAVPRALEVQLTSGDFVLNRNSLTLTLADQPVNVTATEFKLLRLLIESKGEPLTRDRLLKEVWGYSDHALTRTLDTHIKRLREKLGGHADHIQTIRSVGYQFVAVLP